MRAALETRPVGIGFHLIMSLADSAGPGWSRLVPAGR